MPYNKDIDARIHTVISKWDNPTDKKNMFGGICHLIDNKMYCGVYKDYLILRLNKDAAAELLDDNSTRPFDITGRPMKGWIMVEESGLDTSVDISKWLERARDFALSLPAKKK